MDQTPLINSTMETSFPPSLAASTTYSGSSVNESISSTSWRNLIAFFLFGLVNNSIYVIFLSAADDILKNEPDIRKSSILLANIIPCVFVKLIAPYFVRIVPYGMLIAITVICGLGSLLLVGLPEAIWIKFIGIILASTGSGVGETCFMALTSYFHPKVVIAWSSGTGAAGIVGATLYLILTALIGFSLKTTLTIACILPVIMAISYIFILDREEHMVAMRMSSSPRSSANQKSPISIEEAHPSKSTTVSSKDDTNIMTPEEEDTTSFNARIKMIRPLIFRYIVPLFLVYYVEYVINSSIYFSLQYPLEETPFKNHRQHYPTYAAIYQMGVFLSRTFGRMFPVSNGWTFSIIQSAILVLLSVETIYQLIDNIYVVFLVIFLEGLLGGAAYVNTFCNITHQVPKSQLEFSMAFTGIADSTGIGLAGLTSLIYEPFLCARNPICTFNRGA